MAMHRECPRCGITYNVTDHYTEYCSDCLEVEPELVRVGGKNGTLDKGSRDRMIRYYNGRGWTDPEIAQEIGLQNRQAVQSVRKRLGIPAVYRPEKHMWKDQEAHREHARNMVYSRTTEQTKRGMSFYDAPKYRQTSGEVFSDRADTGSADTNKPLS